MHSRKGEDLTLRVFIDKNLVEVFANDRQAVAFAHKHIRENPNIRLFAKGGDAVIKSIKAWKMKSIYQPPTAVDASGSEASLEHEDRGQMRRQTGYDNRVVDHEIIQTMFYKPNSQDSGRMWDTWLFHQDATYYLYYLANAGKRWDNVSMAVSPDGVRWREKGHVLYKRPRRPGWGPALRGNRQITRPTASSS